jgi:hypothetical protein
MEDFDLIQRFKHPRLNQQFLCKLCVKECALSIIKTLGELDKLFLFAEPVTDAIAPNYRDVIANPMSLADMQKHALTASYFDYDWVREFFELMVLNAMVFNGGFSQVFKEAHKFYKTAVEKVFTGDDCVGRYAVASQHAAKIEQCVLDAEKQVGTASGASARAKRTRQRSERASEASAPAKRAQKRARAVHLRSSLLASAKES